MVSRIITGLILMVGGVGSLVAPVKTIITSLITSMVDPMDLNSFEELIFTIYPFIPLALVIYGLFLIVSGIRHKESATQ